jgi:hypothetical protein
MARKNKKDIMDLLDMVMPKQSKKRADKKAKGIIEFMNLAEIRKQDGIRQTGFKVFSQHQISQIEKKEEMMTLTLATLIEYAESIGLGIKLIGYSKVDEDKEFEILSS